MTREFGWDEIDEVEEEPCEYELFDGGEMIRNGSSGNCRRRLKKHRRNIEGVTKVRVRFASTPKQARVIERAVCLTVKPRMNKRCG
jgi:hypothetical protein